MAAAQRDTQRPKCPRPEHAGSRVWLNGMKGPEGHKRPRWKCVPTNGGKAHQFSEILPRQMTHDGFCTECERTYAPQEGPQGARDYLYSIREVAKALIRVGEGATYREAAYAARQHARRGRKSSKHELRYSHHAQLISDWVETFAPVVYEPFHDFAWPATGSVMFDEVPFRTNTGVQGGAKTFSILAAMGWDEERARIRLYRLEAVPERPNMVPAWEGFMRRLSGCPERVVCDRGKSLVKAVGNVFPESEVAYCEYHLKERCYVKLKELGLAQPETPAYDAVERAFMSVKHFEEMKAAWLAIKNPTVRKKLASYLAGVEKVVKPQLEKRSSWPNPASPSGTGALEKQLDWLRSKITYRAAQFTNKERLNRALLLMMLNRNEMCDERAYAERIREWLLVNDGHPRIQRRSVTDPQGRPSLRP
jgi:hypothetical protein